MENGCESTHSDHLFAHDPLSERENEVSIVSREEWNAISPLSTETMDHPVNNVLVSYTDTISCYDRDECIPVLKKLQGKHMADGLQDIAPNFLISGDGTVYEGRGWQFRPQSVEPEKKLSRHAGETINIAFIGQLIGPDRATKHATRMQKKIVDLGLKSGYIYEWYNLQEPEMDRPNNEEPSEKKSVTSYTSL